MHKTALKCDVCREPIKATDIGAEVASSYCDRKFNEMFGKSSVTICKCCYAKSLGVRAVGRCMDMMDVL